LALLDKELYLRIGRPQNTCAQCGAVIATAGKHPSALVDPGKIPVNASEEAVIRHDYCTTCWNALGHTGYAGYWLTRREAPKPRLIKTRKERNAALLAYFEILRERQRNGEDHNQSLYFIAHLLMKYSVLKWVNSIAPTQPGAAEIIVFRYATGSDELVQIESVELDDARVADIKREMDSFLVHALPAENPPHPPLAETA